MVIDYAIYLTDDTVIRLKSNSEVIRDKDFIIIDALEGLHYFSLTQVRMIIRKED